MESGARQTLSSPGPSVHLPGLREASPDPSVLGRKAAILAPQPWWVMAILARLVPPLRRRLAAARHAVGSGLLDSLPQRWEREWRDEFREATGRLRSADLAGLSDERLEAQLDEAIELLQRGQYVHFQLFIPYAVGVHELVTTCAELLGWSALESLELVVQGSS